MLLFEIHRIAYGWFEICLSPHKDSAFLLNSRFMDCDAPRLLLDSLAAIAEGTSRSEWLCWQDEPGAFILHLEADDKNITTEVYRAARESMELPFNGEILKQDAKKLVYSNSFELRRLIDDVLVQFSLYENGNGLALYQRHWSKFPQSEYDRLRACAEKINADLKKYDKMLCLSY